MLNKLLLTALVLMLNYTTAYAWVDCDGETGCIPEVILTIDGIDQLKARVIVKHWPTGTTQECTPIDWVGNCKIDTLIPGRGWYYAAVSFGVTAPLSGIHCDYSGRTPYFYFDGLHQVVKEILLSGRCEHFAETPPPAEE
jgi:hypothetical protein